MRIGFNVPKRNHSPHRHHAYRGRAGAGRVGNKWLTDGTNQSSPWSANRLERVVGDSLCAARGVVGAEYMVV
jgi:hypothetical protein